MCERNEAGWPDDEYLYQIMPMVEEAMMRSLEAEAATAPEHVFSRRFERRMNRLIWLERLGFYRHGVKRTGRVMWAAVMAVLVAAGVILVAVFSVEANRVRVVEWLSDVHDKYTNITVEKKHENEAVNFTATMPSYIPDGYAIVKCEEFAVTNAVQYENEQGKTIEFDQVRAEDMSFLVDTEDAATGTVVIGDVDYHTIEKGERCFIYWTDEVYAYTILGWESKEELLKMAGSVKGYTHVDAGTNYDTVKSIIQNDRPIYASLTGGEAAHGVVIAGFDTGSGYYYYKLMDPNKTSLVTVELNSKTATSFTYNASGSNTYTKWRCRMF